MEQKTNIWTTIFLLIIIGICCYFVYLLFVFLPKYILLVSPNIAVAIIAGLVTVTGYFLTRNFERKKLIEQQIREKKLPVYEDFINFLFKVLEASQSDIPISEQEMKTFLFDFNKKSIVWLSDETLQAFIKWRTVSIESVSTAENNIKNLFVLEELIFQFRKDIGHKNKGLKRGDILAVFINDIKRYL